MDRLPDIATPTPDDPLLALLNPWQRGFPLIVKPFAVVAARAGLSSAEVIEHYRALHAAGVLSRVGGVFAPTSGGAAVLAAMRVPASRIDAVASLVSAHAGVNHNYEREHALNLWFVVTGRDACEVGRTVSAIECASGLPALRLPMRRRYRIDLGFDFRHDTAPGCMAAASDGYPVAPHEHALAAAVEEGLPLLPRPYDAWAERLGLSPTDVLATLERWLAHGTLSRFGAIVRHRELGFEANAMTVFDVPDGAVDACGEALSREPGVTLCYRRERHAEWPYNLYCMVHGRDRDAVRAVIHRAATHSGAGRYRSAVLFSLRRFKQTGSRRFRDTSTGEMRHAVA